MKERYKSLVAVYLILTRKTIDGVEVLLQKRQNTGYMDGYYDLGATGHLEENESVRDATVREAMEEVKIKIKPEDLMLVTTFNEKTTDFSYVRFFFHTEKYEGEISIGETDKCCELGWYNIEDLPKDIIPHLKKELENFKNGVNYGENGFKL